MFRLHNAVGRPVLDLPGLDVRDEPVVAGTAAFDLDVQLTESADGQGVHGTLRAAADLFDQKMEGTAWKSKPNWFIVALFGVLPAIWFVRFRRRRERLLQGRCRRCGYDLRATPQRCPECGAIAVAIPQAAGVSIRRQT